MPRYLLEQKKEKKDSRTFPVHKINTPKKEKAEYILVQFKGTTWPKGRR